jgi:hypothetical protein
MTRSPLSSDGRKPTPPRHRPRHLRLLHAVGNHKVSGVAVWVLAFLYGRGGFDLVLGVNAAVALALLVAVVFIAVIANGVEKARVPQPAPAE